MTRSRKNTAKYQKIFRLRSEGKKFQEIADEMGVSRQRVWQIYDRVTRRMQSVSVMSMPSKQFEKSA